MDPTMDRNASFDVIPTEDGMGYMVRLCRNGTCSQAFISSMHLVDSKRPQLEDSLNS